MKSNRLLTIEPPESCEWVRSKDFRILVLKEPVVLINGAFDLLHPGHLRLIRQARLRAGTLICGLDSDKKVRGNKGGGRPIMSYPERAVSLGYVGIDYLVEIDNDEDMRGIIRYAKPSFRLLGADYMNKPTRFPEVKRLYVRLWGKGQEKVGTTEIIERCQRVVI